MNRRDQYGNASQPGSNRDDEDRSWDSPRQASQWSDTGRQAGGDAGQRDRGGGQYGEGQYGSQYGGGQYGAGQRSDRRDSDQRAGDRFGSSERGYGSQHDRWQDRDYGGTSPGFQDRGFSGSSGYGQGRSQGWERHQGDFSAHRDRGSDWGSASRGQAYGGDRWQNSGAYSPRSYDASFGQDYSSFTGDDFGGRDFTARKSGGYSGGMQPSDTYRPSYGLSGGDWFGSSSRNRDEDDYASWRRAGESRGFLARAGDEIASWFGDENAARRREQDHQADHRGRGPSDYTRSDERIREDVNDKLTHDWRVDATAIRVSVKDGEVSLEGTVASRDAKRRAEDLADDVTGVKHVQNNLRVQASAGSASASGWSDKTAAGTDSTGSWSGGSAAGLTGSGASAASTSASGSTTTGSISSTGTTAAGTTARSSDKSS